MCDDHGVTKLDWLLAHARRTPEDDEARDLLDAKLPVTSDDAGEPEMKPFSEMSMEELRGVGREERSKAARAKKKAAMPAPVRDILLELGRVLDANVPK